MAGASTDWTPSSWRDRPALQQPEYADSDAVDRVMAEIAHRGPLATPEASAALREACAEAARGVSFIVQAGDCAESLDNDPVEAADAMNALIAMLARSIGGNVVPIARIAGQFAKPRTNAAETREGVTLPAYRGDAVNGCKFDAQARSHDPKRLIAVYRHSAETLEQLSRHGRPPFASHEALILPYEEALCTRDETGRWWAGSGHMLWIGERTRQLDGAHVAFASGIENVVGVKCGPTIGPDELVALADVLDRKRTPGKLLFIGRFGADRIESCLPPLLRAARREGLAAGWLTDPMHGNTRYDGVRKQRRLSDMAAEVEAFFTICHREGMAPAGIHLEVTTNSEAECIGVDGRDPMADFPCDPRLNAEQARSLVALAEAHRRVPASA